MIEQLDVERIQEIFLEEIFTTSTLIEYINDYVLSNKDFEIKQTAVIKKYQIVPPGKIIPFDGTQLKFDTIVVDETTNLLEEFNSDNFFSIVVSHTGFEDPNETSSNELYIDQDNIHDMDPEWEWRYVGDDRGEGNFIDLTEEQISDRFDDGITDEELVLFLTSYGFDKIKGDEYELKVTFLRGTIPYIEPGREYTDEEIKATDVDFVHRPMDINNISGEVKISRGIYFSTGSRGFDIVNDESPDNRWVINSIHF